MTSSLIDLDDRLRFCTQCIGCIHWFPGDGKECSIYGTLPDDIFEFRKRCEHVKHDDPELDDMLEKFLRKWHPDIAK